MASEFDLIRKFAERAAGAPGADDDRLVLGIGDDAAVARTSGVSVTSVDLVVEGVHFRMPHSSLRQAGRKALSVALSDLAAMGAAAGEAYVAVVLPTRLSDAECLELYGGLAEVADETGTRVAGGDISSGPCVVLAVTVVGHAESASRLVGRAGARPGDVLVITGELGGAAAGLALQSEPGLRDDIDDALADALVRRQVDPTPRLAAGAALAAAGATAMIDISDGLGADAAQLAAAGPAWLRIELDGLPIQPGVRELAVAAGLDPLDLATAGGEDYELVAALPPQRVSEAVAAVRPLALTVIGEVSTGSGVELRGPDGVPRPPRGFDHRQSR